MSASRLTKSRGRSCANCAAFARTGTAAVYGGSGIIREVGEQARGDCRARPPEIDPADGEGRWPTVVADQWCAQFSDRRAASKSGAA